MPVMYAQSQLHHGPISPALAVGVLGVLDADATAVRAGQDCTLQAVMHSNGGWHVVVLNEAGHGTRVADELHLPAEREVDQAWCAVLVNAISVLCLDLPESSSSTPFLITPVKMCNVVLDACD